MLADIERIVGIAAGLLSLAGFIYIVAFWKGGLDNWRKSVQEEREKYPPGETCLMVKTMWDIYVVGALKDRPDLATHQSPFKLTPDAENLIPKEVKDELCGVDIRPEDAENVASGWLVVKVLGLDRIEHISREKKLSMPETIAILSTYLDNHCNHF
jgi:hypothetical protein